MHVENMHKLILIIMEHAVDAHVCQLSGAPLFLENKSSW